MSRFQRVKSFTAGILMILFALLMLLAPEEFYDTLAAIISFMMIIYGLRLLIYYFRMARHMVGGKSTLYQAIVVLDAALFTLAVASMNSFIIMMYLLGIYAFSGAVDILRAFEAKRNGASWKMKFLTGCISVLFAVMLVITGVVLKKTEILVYGFGISLIYSATVRIASAFRRTAIVYIQ
ncbi:MAG: DUF308 domain-containing protein [Ruminococcus sp.]|nr:DUF308 domain-containing protein [Ruminococcus sp.]